jgi:stage II sporulation protein E
MEVLLLKPESVSPVSLQGVVTRGCGVDMRTCLRDGLLSTQALFEQVPELDIEVGALTRSRSGEDVAGDSYVSRSLPGGRQVLALSDGMGSGVDALQESHACLQLMVESLRAGYTRAQAIDVVNSLMLMCTGREMYATMDLCVCDLHSGEAAFEKLGACASYIVRDGEVRSIGSDTLPVGVLPDVESSSLRMTLQCGDVVIMLTDGVAGAYPGGEEALRAAIAKLYWLHPQAVGERLIEQCLQEGRARDDMAVLCMRVGRRMKETQS